MTDLSQLAHGAIHRTDDRLRSPRERAQAGLEFPGKECIERRVAGQIFIGGFAHVYAVAADKPTYDSGENGTGRAAVRQFPSQPGDQQLRNHILYQYKKPVEHESETFHCRAREFNKTSLSVENIYRFYRYKMSLLSSLDSE